MAALSREILQKLARIRLREARLLLHSHLFDGAYHVAGFAVECALKACIARKVVRNQFPDKWIKDVFTHNLQKLVDLAALTGSLKAERTNPAFDVNWSIVSKWDPEVRYELSKKRTDAAGLYSAITARRHGVLQWIRNHW